MHLPVAERHLIVLADAEEATQMRRRIEVRPAPLPGAPVAVAPAM